MSMMSVVCRNTSMEVLTPLFDCVVDVALVQVHPPLRHLVACA